MSRRRPLLLACLLLAGAARGARAADEDATWRLGRSDMARYERVTVRARDGAASRTDPKIVTVHGHDLRDGGQYDPAAPVIDDLPRLLALRLPAAGQAETAVKLDWEPQHAPPVRIRGRVAVTGREAGRVRLAGSFTFASRGRAARRDRWWVEDGEAHTEVDFDVARGVPRTARATFDYRRTDMRADGPASVARKQGTWEWALQEVVAARPEDFQARVDRAIDAGVAHLRTLQEESGSFKPQGDYRTGTTALAVLTLVTCGVPREDPQVERALAWMFQQEPQKTYERAVCLMAVDRAWTPGAELALRAQGRPVERPVRDLPPERMAWVRRTAAALEESATSPGSFGYPPAARSLLTFDTSNTQYAVLGLRAAVHLGYDVKERTWLGVVRHVAVVAERKGPKGSVSLVLQGEAVPDEATAHLLHLRHVPAVAGLRYSTLEAHDHVDGAMTCAGISCLLVARDALQHGDVRKWTPALAKEIDALLDGAWAWLQAHWRVDHHPEAPGGNWYYYWLYSLERAAVLGSVKRVGGCDWYFEGAMELIVRQQQREKPGAWNHPGRDEVPPTCFALLFLKRGTTPLSTPVTGR